MSAPGPTAFSALRSWWGQNRVRAGFIPAARTLALIAWEFLRESMPDRARERFGDMDYDWEHRVDTTSANVSWRARWIGLLNSSYQPIEAPLFQEMLGALSIDYRQFTFIDIGSGKGRPLLMASEYPFGKIIGVELLPELNAIAQENIRKFPEERKRCKQMEAVLGDATQFRFPLEPLVVFMFHPLLDTAFEKVMTNLQASFLTHRRPVWLVYANPLYESLVLETGRFRKVLGTLHYSIFAAQEGQR
ncbi:MAG TPA: class I SAM-dependent methyltransferase [Terriglobales bacterium]|nr:class I SAM-dependent methyltransferase [Terriglobales bacterium]